MGDLGGVWGEWWTGGIGMRGELEECTVECGFGGPGGKESAEYHGGSVEMASARHRTSVKARYVLRQAGFFSYALRGDKRICAVRRKIVTMHCLGVCPSQGDHSGILG